jgi:hypothetical protein
VAPEISKGLLMKKKSLVYFSHYNARCYLQCVGNVGAGYGNFKHFWGYLRKSAAKIISGFKGSGFNSIEIELKRHFIR